jgi:peptide/nickel transport system permease protein
MLSRIIPAIGSLRERGLSGWLVIFGAAIVISIILMTLLAPWISPYDPTTKGVNVGAPLTPPNSKFPFGTNHLGQDMLSRVISGGGVMLQVAFLSVAICLAIGVPLGLFSSYMGGIFDRSVCLVMDSIYAFPGLILAIAIAAMLGRGVVNMALSIAVVYVPSYFRVVRSQVLSIKEMPYVEAARSIGAKSRTILFEYILPNVVPSIVVVATVNFADAILTAAGLTFVGLGVEGTSLTGDGILQTVVSSFQAGLGGL